MAQHRHDQVPGGVHAVRRRLTALVAALVVAASLAAHEAPVGADGPGLVVDTSSRQAMRESYLDVLAPALATPVDWTGSEAGCVPGAPSAAAQDATLLAVNWYRAANDLLPVGFDPVLSAKAQQAALMMQAQGALSHSPPPDWACWTAEGAEAANASNLYRGRTGPDAIAGYMVDPGAGNTAAGHRHWILDPRLRTMGSGSTSGANALWVVSTPSSRDHQPAWITWPPAGYLPAQLEPQGRWSVMANSANADFTGATVTVTSGGQDVPVTIEHADDSWYHPAVVFRVDPELSPGMADRTFTVSVSGVVVDGTPTSHTYDVTLFDASVADPPLFSDVGADHLFHDAIAWLVAEGITLGYPDGTFRPVLPVARQEMAAFLWRQAGEPEVVLASPAFADVAPSNPFYVPVQWMAQAGLSVGTPGPHGSLLFQPGRTVARQEMAAFLWRQAGEPATSWPTQAFADVAGTHPFYVPVQWMAENGLSSGTPNPGGAPWYQPASAVSRQAMAAFLQRAALVPAT